jgi:hypothetical protein
MFITPLFTIAKLWKQPRCPTTDEWIKKMWYIYIYNRVLSAIKKEVMLFTGKRMELEIIMVSEVSQVL